MKYQELALLVQVSPPSEALSYVCVRTGANIRSPRAKNSPGGFCVHDSLGRRSWGQTPKSQSHRKSCALVLVLLILAWELLTSTPYNFVSPLPKRGRNLQTCECVVRTKIESTDILFLVAE